ncbi:MAG: GntR family transcriptional regulator [Bacillota bacterium]
MEGWSAQKYRPLADLVYDDLRNAILEGRLRPGQRVFQEELAQTLGVSRTPIRDALQRLEAEGFVDVTAGKGLVVRRFRLEDIKDTYMVRGLLEPKAIEMAVSRITDEQIKALERLQSDMERLVKEEGSQDELLDANRRFHGLIFEACGSKRLESIIQSLRSSYPRYGFSIFIDHADQSLREHREIVDAIRARDVERAVAAHTGHLRTSFEALTEYFSRVIPEEDAPS